MISLPLKTKRQLTHVAVSKSEGSLVMAVCGVRFWSAEYCSTEVTQIFNMSVIYGTPIRVVWVQKGATPIRKTNSLPLPRTCCGPSFTHSLQHWAVLRAIGVDRTVSSVASSRRPRRSVD